MRHFIIVAVSFVVLLGCDQASTVQTTPQAGSQEAAESIGTMELLRLAEQARQKLPGKPVYEDICASCHEGGVERAPGTNMLGMMTPEAIVQVLTTGIMRDEAVDLTAEQKDQVAEYLTGRAPGSGAGLAEPPRCAQTNYWFDYDDVPPFSGWGLTPDNSHHIEPAVAGISREDLPQLELQWAFAFPGANRARSQPMPAGGMLYVGSQSGHVYALDRDTGCVQWDFQASAEVRTTILIDPWVPGDREAKPKLYFGDILGNVYAIDALTGFEVWRDKADDHPNATASGSPTLHNGVLYVPVSSYETGPAADPAYECCTFRGSLIAYDAASGARKWQSFTIEEAPSFQRKNPSGTDNFGPSGAPIWNAPAIDEKRGQIYVGTGENYSSPATLTSDAILAFDMATGALNWSYQATANDAWNGACSTSRPDNCPVENGPDFDFGAATILVTDSDGKDYVLGGDKGGMVHALDPDTGAVIWKQRVGRGGIQGGVHFAIAAAHDKVYVGISDMIDGKTYDTPARPGVYALDLRTGREVWGMPAEQGVCKGRLFCDPGFAQTLTLSGDLVVAGSMAGVMYIFDAQTGEQLWRYDTTRPVTTVSGEETAGGSLGGSAAPILYDGQLFIMSGYGLYLHMPGNALLVFGKPAVE